MDTATSSSGNNAKVIFSVCLAVAVLTATFALTQMSVNREEAQTLPVYKPAKIPAPKTSAEVNSIDQAYAMTNVNRVSFDAVQSKLPMEEREYFKALFSITDVIVVERVTNFRAITTKKPITNIWKYDLAIEALKKFTPPESAKEIHELILSSIQDQRDYFQFLSETKDGFNTNNPLVQRSHNNLIKAWQLMLAAYQVETPQNKLSFEKHLCALDFI